MMDLEQKNVEHPAQDETIIANKIILTYAQYGMIPMVLPPVVSEFPIPVERTPVQRGTDLAYLNEMAGRHGYVFYITPGPAPFTNSAYWGPPNLVGTEQRALSVNLGPQSNVTSINFQHNGLAPSLVSGHVQDRITNQTTPVRTFVSTRIPLSSQPSTIANQPNVRTTRFGENGLNIMQAYGRAQSMTDSSTDNVVSASGELDAARYGEILTIQKLGGSARCGIHLRWFLLCQKCHPLDYAWRV